jgi:hypothetical protein
MEYLKIAAACILHLRKQTSYNTTKSWIEWRETILPVLEDHVHAGTINAAINAGKIAARKIKSIDALTTLLATISVEDRVKIMEIIVLFRIIDEKRNDYIPETFNIEVWNELISVVNVSSEQLAQSEIKAQEWFEFKKENKFKTNVYVPASILPITLDFLLRCFVLFIFQHWSTVWDVNGPHPFFVITQVILIPLIIIVFAIIRDRKISKHGQFLVSKIDMNNIQFKIKNTAWNYLLIFILILSGSFIPILFSNEDLSIFLIISMVIIYGVYLLILQTNFSKSLPEYKKIKQQIEDKEHRELSGELHSDQNDEEIINLEVNLKAENERMDAYVIEAALFGTLAFSGFIQIVASKDFSVEFIENFNHHVFLILKGMVNPGVQHVQESYDFIFSNNGLMMVLCYQTLFCSVFFLSVIGSRLRYSKLTDYVDRYLHLAKALNEKEEFLLHKENVNAEEVTIYSTKIKHLLREGYKKQDEIFPIMEFMKFFRTLGISMFFTVIVTSGLFISLWLSFILFFVAILSLIYFRFGKVKSAIKSFYIAMQEFYYRVDKPVHYICWSIIILALVMRTFRVAGGGPMMALGFMFLFIHYLLNLFIPIEFDYDVKKSEDAFGSYATFQKLLVYLFKMALAVFFLGYMFKAMHWPGAGPMLIASIIMLCAYFLTVKKVPQGPTWLGYLLGISISLSFIGIMFKIQHWPGAGFVPYASIPLILITGVITYLKREQIRSLLKRTVFILCFLGITFSSDYLRKSIWTLNFNYDVYLTEKKRTDVMNRFYSHNGGIQPYLETQNDSTVQFLSEFNSLFMVDKESDYSEFLNEVAWKVYENIDNPMVLNEAVKWSAKSIEKDDNWTYLDTYASLLYKLKRYEEAKPAAEKAYLLGKDPSTKKLLDDIVKNLALNKEKELLESQVTK